MALGPLGQPFGGGSQLINVGAPAGIEQALAIGQQGISQLGAGIGSFVRQRKQKQLEDADRTLFGQVLGQLQGEDVSSENLSNALSALSGFQSDKFRNAADQFSFSQLSQRLDPQARATLGKTLAETGAIEAGPRPTPQTPAEQAATEALAAQRIAQTGQVGKPAPQTAAQQALTKAQTGKIIAETPDLTLGEQRKRDLIAAGITSKAISKLERDQIKSVISKNRAESEKLLREAKGNLTPEQIISQGNTFRKEFDALSKDFRTIRDSFQRINAAAADPSPAGDLAIIFNFMKIQDPRSTVRESEFATAENAAGVPVKIRNMWNKLLTGERIAFNRQDFVKTAGNLFRSQQNTQNKLIKRYTSLSERFGVDPRDVITETDITISPEAPVGTNQLIPLSPTEESRRQELIRKAGQ